jgi:hypothetical protein
MDVSSQAHMLANEIGNRPMFHTVCTGDIGDIGIIYLRDYRVENLPPENPAGPAGDFVQMKNSVLLHSQV